MPDAERREEPTAPDPLTASPEDLAEARLQTRYWVSEYDGTRGSTGHGGRPSFAEACEMAKNLSKEKSDRAFRVLDPDNEIVAVAMNGKVTNADGNGPAIDPNGPPPKNAKKYRPWRRKDSADEKPQSWSNWNASLSGGQPTCAEEFDLYSDSTIHGVERDFGPYRVINLIVGPRRETAMGRRDHATSLGDRAMVQRCQVHKARNVRDHLPEARRAYIARQKRDAYDSATAATAKKKLLQLASWLAKT